MSLSHSHQNRRLLTGICFTGEILVRTWPGCGEHSVISNLRSVFLMELSGSIGKETAGNFFQLEAFYQITRHIKSWVLILIHHFLCHWKYSSTWHKCVFFNCLHQTQLHRLSVYPSCLLKNCSFCHVNLFYVQHGFPFLMETSKFSKIPFPGFILEAFIVEQNEIQ